MKISKTSTYIARVIMILFAVLLGIVIYSAINTPVAQKETAKEERTCYQEKVENNLITTCILK